MTALTLDLRPVIRLTHQQFEQIALANQDLRLELTAAGELVLMPPTGGNTGRRNSDLTYQLETWNRRSKLGVVFDSLNSIALTDQWTLWMPRQRFPVKRSFPVFQCLRQPSGENS